MSRILLVDDDPALLAALPEALVRRLPGCSIETANSAEAALPLIERGGFDLVISDLLMSGSGGAGLVQALEQMSPPLPTILITGVPEIRGGRFPALPLSMILQKPFDVSVLAAMVRQVLDKRNRTEE